MELGLNIHTRGIIDELLAQKSSKYLKIYKVLIKVWRSVGSEHQMIVLESHEVMKWLLPYSAVLNCPTLHVNILVLIYQNLPPCLTTGDVSRHHYRD